MADRERILEYLSRCLLAQVGEIGKREIIIEVPDRFGQELKPEKVNCEIKGEIVRCNDCKYQNWVNVETGCIVCKFGRGTNAPDWFCADGERR